MAVTDGGRTRMRAPGRGVIGWCAPLLLALLLCAAPGARADGPADAGVARTRVTFDGAFEDLRARLPEAAARPGHPLHALHALLEFRRTHVGWLTLDGDRYLGAERSTLRSWMVVVPEGHPRERGMQSSLEMNAIDGRLFIVHIAEAEYHPAWAMLFAIHELTHLHDRDLGIESLHPNRRELLDAEIRAYRNELQVAELLSDGGFVRALDALLDAWAPTSLRDVDLYAMDLTRKDAARLSQAIDHAEARSDTEEGLRLGFFYVALVLRHAERTGLGDDAVRRVLGSRILMSENTKAVK